MQSGTLALLAFSPILLAAILLVGLRWPAKRAMPVVYVITALIGLFVWDMSVNRVLASTLQGLVITIGVLWIIFGAILLLNTLKYSGGISAIRAGFATISPFWCVSCRSRRWHRRHASARPGPRYALAHL